MTIDRERVLGSGVVVVASHPRGDRRDFRIEPDSDPELAPALDGLEHEEQLVAKMTEHGFRLTFVAGGSRTEEVRRFYFRKT